MHGNLCLSGQYVVHRVQTRPSLTQPAINLNVSSGARNLEQGPRLGLPPFWRHIRERLHSATATDRQTLCVR
jgi:hypothetical protein